MYVVIFTRFKTNLIPLSSLSQWKRCDFKSWNS